MSQITEATITAKPTNPTVADPIVLDVRPLARQHRHLLVFRQYELLALGEAFELVNDHDPLGLLHQFRQIVPGLFTWDYLRPGPDEWRVLIGRTQAPASADTHIHDEGCTCDSSIGGCG